MADQKDIGKALEDSLRISKQVNAGTQQQNADLAKSISLLSKINDLRDSSIAKVKALNRETINTKQIQKELEKAEAKKQLAAIKTADLEKNMSTAQKNAAIGYIAQIDAIKKKEEEISRAKAVGNRVLERQLSRQLTTLDASLQTMEQQLGFEERKLAAAMQARNVAQENADVLKEELNSEKQINKSIGFTGKAMGFLATKLGVGSQYYGEMVEKARDLAEEGKKLSFGDKLGGLAKAAGGGILEALGDPLTAIPLIGGAIGGIVKGLKTAFDYILGIQDKTVKFARAMNMSTQEARQLKMQYADINVSNGDLFVNTQKLVEAQSEMVGLLGVTNRISTQNLATNIKLKDIAGLEADTIASITESSIINGKSNETIVKSVFAQVKGLKQATGIQFENKKILKEASSLGGYLGLQFSKYPAQLTKSLLTVKAMGMELKQLDSMADSFLDFESSISKEFEAQLLTGRDINLTKARELFLNNDLAGAAMEINNQVGSSADFMKLNRIQAESLSQAFGMSRDQMGDMLKKQEMLSKLGAKDTDTAREQLKLGLAKYKNEKELAAAIGEQNYQNLINASLQEKIAAFIEKIKESIANFVEKSGIIDKIEHFMNYLSEPENIRKIIMGVRDFFAGAVEFIGKAAYYILEGLDYVAFGQIPDSFIDSIKSGAENMGAQIRSMGGDLSATAAKEKAGSSGGNANRGESSSKNYSSPMGVSKTDVTVKVRDRDLFVVSYTGYNEGANVDQQISTKHSTNPIQ